MTLKELITKLNEDAGEGTFNMTDLRLDGSGDLWIYDPDELSGSDLCRQTGNGEVVLYEDWAYGNDPDEVAENALKMEYPNAELSHDQFYWRIDIHTGLGDSLYPLEDFTLLEAVNDLLFRLYEE